MSTLPQRVSSIALSVAAIFAATEAVAVTPNSADALDSLRVVDRDVLSKMRGGFTGSVGGQRLELSFGIEQALFVNDALLVTTRLTVPDVNQPGQAQLTVTPVAPTPPSVVAPTPPTPPAVVAPIAPTAPAVVAPTPPTPPAVVAPTAPTAPAVVAPTPPTAPVLVAPTAPVVVAPTAPTAPIVVTPTAPTSPVVVAPTPPTGPAVVAPTPATAPTVVAPTSPTAPAVVAPTAPTAPVLVAPTAPTNPTLATPTAPTGSTVVAPTPPTSPTVLAPTPPTLVSPTPPSAAGGSQVAAQTKAPTPALTNSGNPSATTQRTVSGSTPTVAVPVGGPSSLQVPVSNSALQSVPLRVGDVSVTTIAGSHGLVNVVQIGRGNSFTLDPSNLASGVMNVIQNTLDNQTIRQTTGIQVSANSLTLMRANTFAAAFQRQLLQSIR